MSFGRGDFGGGSLTNSSGASSSSTMDYNRITQVVSANTTKITNHVKEIKKLAEQVGTEHDNSDVRTKIQTTQTTTKRLCQDTEKLLNELKSLPAPDVQAEKRERRITLTRLANNYSNALNEYQKSTRELLNREKASISQQTTTSEGNSLIALDNNASGQAQLQQQLSPNEMAAMHERESAIIQLEVTNAQQSQMLVEKDPLQRQQDEELGRLEQEIEDMADVFTEVHKLVHDQGEVVGKKKKIKRTFSFNQNCGPRQPVFCRNVVVAKLVVLFIIL